MKDISSQERFNRVLASHSEFKELQEWEQHMHLGMTLFPALAITFARGETCNSGVDQLEFYGQVRTKNRSFGVQFIFHAELSIDSNPIPLFLRSQLDLESHEVTYGHIGTKRLKKIEIKSLNQATRMMDAETEEKYVEYCNRLKKLVQHSDQRIYKVKRL